jgi:hypothetical protein
VYIGAVQPWLEFSNQTTRWHTNRAPNFATVSGLAGIGALIALLALFSFRPPKPARPAPSAPELLAQIHARAIEMMIAGLALALSGLGGFLFGMAMAARLVAAVADPGGTVLSHRAFGVWVVILLFPCGIAAFVGSLAMRKRRAHTFALVMSILLMLVLPACLLGSFAVQPELILFQAAFAFYAGLRAFRLLRRPEVEKVFAALGEPAPVGVPFPALAAQPLDHRISEAVTGGLPGWFNRRARWVQQLVQIALGIMIAIGCFTLLGFRMQQKTEAVAGGAMLNSGTLEIGQPWPWLTVRGGPLSHGVFVHWGSPALWLALLGAAACGVSEMLRRSRPGLDLAADRRKSRIGWSVAAFFIVLWIVAMGFMASSVMGIHGVPTPGTLARATGGIFAAKPEIRVDYSQIPTARTPGRTDYAYKFTVPENHRLFVWLEWWKEGKRTIDGTVNSGYFHGRDKGFDGGFQLTFTDGKTSGPATEGQTRIDYIFTEPHGHSSSGNWRPDFFAGMMTTNSWGQVPIWKPKAGETVTLLEIAGGKESVLSGPITEDGLRAGHWQAAMLLKARIEPVPEWGLQPTPTTKGNAWNDNEDPSPALLRLGEPFGATLGPFTDARNLREQIAYQLQKDAARAKAEQMLSDKGAAPLSDAKPEDLVRALENFP